MLSDLIDLSQDISLTLEDPIQRGESKDGNQDVEVVSLRLEDKQQYVNVDSYITSPIVYYEWLLDLEAGDDVEQVVSHKGRLLIGVEEGNKLEVSLDKVTKNVRHFRLAFSRLYIFRSLNDDYVLAFNKWYHGQTNGTILCSLASQHYYYFFRSGWNT